MPLTDNPSWRPDDLGHGQPGPPADDLAALLTQVVRGNEAAFAAVYTRVSGHVFGIVRSVLRDPAQAEEVTQEVLLEVWRDAARFDVARGSAMAWVVTLASVFMMSWTQLASDTSRWYLGYSSAVIFWAIQSAKNFS